MDVQPSLGVDFSFCGHRLHGGTKTEAHTLRNGEVSLAFVINITARVRDPSWLAQPKPAPAGEGWSQLSGLNRRPTVYKTVALPLS